MQRKLPEAKEFSCGTGIAVLHGEANPRKVLMTQSADKCIEFQVMTLCKIQLRLLFSSTHHNMKKEHPGHRAPQDPC